MFPRDSSESVREPEIKSFPSELLQVNTCQLSTCREQNSMAVASPPHNSDLTADKVEDGAFSFVDGSDQPANFEALALH